MTLTWTAPTSDGGAAISGYEYEVNGNGTWTSTGGTGLSVTGTGLTNGTAYTFLVRAVNSAGAGTASNAATATLMAAVAPTELTATESFSIPDRGGQSITSSATGKTLRVGYGGIRADAGSTTPSGIAIFQFRDSDGVLISEAGVPAVEPVQEGRIFAEVNGPVNTGLAIANPNDGPATIRFYFTDTSGTRFADGSFELGAHHQIAKFLDQAPFTGSGSVLGTFTFTASVPVAVVALRGLTNEAGEFLMTTLPVAPVSSTFSDTVHLPHFADGGGWATQVILVNPTDRTITGTVGFLGPGSDTAAASPVVLALDDGSTGSDFDYSIAPRSAQRFTTSNPPGGLAVGSVRATPDRGNTAPAGLVVFSFARGEKTLSEAGVPALPKGSAFRVYVEASGVPGQVGSIRSGLAIANAGATTNTVTLEVTHLDGSLAVPPATLALPPLGQSARFLDEIFSLPDNFSGVVRVTSTAEVAIVGLRLRVNERGELKMTTTPPSNETGPSTTAERFFPHIADSGGWSTQFILFSGTAGQASSGTLRFIDASGQPLALGVSPAVGIPAAESPEFDLASDNGNPTGITFANDRLFVVDVEDDKVYAYRASGQPDALSDFDLDSDNGTPDGITFANDRFYVVDGFDAKVYAYRASGHRDALSDFDLDSNNASARGIIFANDRFYVVDLFDEKVYAYRASGQRDAAFDFDLDPDYATTVGATVARGITFANDRFYVVDIVDEKVYAYRASGQRDAAFDFDLDPDYATTVGATVARGITFANDRFYVVDRAHDKVQAYRTSGERDAAPEFDLVSEFDLASDDIKASGITFANDRLYVADWWDDKVYAYRTSGERDALSDFDLDPDNGTPDGITFANDRFYVVDISDEKVYAYRASGQRDALSDFDLASDNTDATGITFANDRFYVVDSEDDRVYAYDASGQRDGAPEFDLDSDNTRPSGITFANDRFYVVEKFPVQLIYRYRAFGQFEAASEVDLTFGSLTAAGITFAADRFYVVDWTDDKVYVYALTR